jgi:hypothetical protein
VAALLTATFSQRVAAADDYDPSGRVARLSYLRGSISFQPAGESDWVSAKANRPMTTADRLWADEDGRAEIQLGSATIRLDSLTGMSFLNLDDRTTQIELSVGTMYVRVLRLGRDEIFEIATPNQAFSILRPGQYRIEASEDGNSTMVTVRAGEGEATGSGRIYEVGPGETGRFTGTVPLRASIFRAAGYDEFDRWCEDRNRRDDRARSVRYVSPDVVGYQDLDDYGVWYSDSNYGHVWMPRVARGWAPYQYGHWVWISPWGWTWVDDAPWGYAPFHYGRWVYVRNTWGWVPGPIAVRPVYAPALVAFIGGPRFSVSVAVGGGGGYVGWFPLGPREVYVPAYRTSREYVTRVNVSNTTVTNINITNVYNETHNNTHNNIHNNNIRYANKTAPGGVTTVSHGTFVNAQPVHRAVVAVNDREIKSAPISRRAEVVPTRSSVLGTSGQSDRRAARPSAEIANRSVVARTPPPSPPVPFERQRQKLEAQPGQPLARSEIDRLRPANASQPRSNVSQAPPGRASTADSNQPGSRPASGPPARTDRPDGVNRGRPASASTSNPAPDVDRNPRAEDAPPPRADRPSGVNRGRPASASISNPAPDVDRNPRAEVAPPARADRPSGTNRGPASASISNPAPDPDRNPRAEAAPSPRADRPSGANRGPVSASTSNPAPDPDRNPRAEAAPSPRADRPSGANRGRSANAPPSDAAPNVDRNPRAQEGPASRADQPGTSPRREPAARPAGSPEASTPAEAKRRQNEQKTEQETDEKAQKKQN